MELRCGAGARPRRTVCGSGADVPLLRRAAEARCPAATWGPHLRTRTQSSGEAPTPRLPPSVAWVAGSEAMKKSAGSLFHDAGKLQTAEHGQDFVDRACTTGRDLVDVPRAAVQKRCDGPFGCTEVIGQRPDRSQHRRFLRESGRGELREVGEQVERIQERRGAVSDETVGTYRGQARDR